MYQRTTTDSVPSQPTQASTYVFATGALTPATNNGWSTQLLAANADTTNTFIWITAVSVASSSAEVMIAANRWSTAALLAQRGEAGTSVTVTPNANGAVVSDGTTSVTINNGTNGMNGINPTVTSITGGVRVTDGDGTSVDVLDGATGDDGDGLEIIYQASATLPATPMPSAGAPSGWSFTIPTRATGQRLYISIGTRVNNMGNYTWTPAVVLEGNDGAQGIQGPDGDDGSTVVTLNLYTRTASTVAPTTNPINNVIYTIATNTFTSVNLGNNWTTVIPAALTSDEDVLWVRQFTMTVSASTPTVTVAFNAWGTPRVISRRGAIGPQGDEGGDGAPGTNGAGIYELFSQQNQGELDGLDSASITAFFSLAAVAGRPPVNSDVFILRGENSAVRTVRFNGSVWANVDAFLDGNLVVDGSITGRTIAAGTINANLLNVSQLSAISADLGTITAGTINGGTINGALANITNINANNINSGGINATNVNITNLNADNISTGTLDVDRLRIDNATLDTDTSGNLVVSTINGGGLTVTPSGLGVSVDGVTTVIRNGRIESIGQTQAPINTVTWSGGQTGRAFNQTPVILNANSLNNAQFGESIFFWRYDMNVIGSAQYQALTGITLENFDVNITVNSIRQSFDTGTLTTDARFDLTYFTSSGTTTGFNTASTFDGRIVIPNFNQPPFTTTSSNGSGTFSTIGSQFSPPAGNDRFLFLGWSFAAERTESGIVSGTGDITYSATFPAQSDTRMILHFENGASRTENFNNFFIV